MKIYYDIHIHSVLSSCADDSQTPNNILNMCMLKGLNMISICDHNTSKQYMAIDKLKDSYDFFIMYGIEITVNEGFHVLAYFEKYEEIMNVDKIIDNSLNKSILPPDEQLLMDEYDEIVDSIPYMINQKCKYTFLEICKIIRENNGLIIPAHIDRKNSGILSYYQNISDFDIDGIEIYDLSKVDELYNNYPFLRKYRYINNSDAHEIALIHEQDCCLELDDASFSSFRKWLKNE